MVKRSLLHSPWPYLTGWFIINVMQSLSTGLAHDEAYYWMYSTDLAWGYFDHPPMTAVVIWLGSLLFEGTLGVRLGIVMMSTATLWLLWDIIRPRRTALFFLITGAIAIIHVGGFFAAPDIPLVFFSSLFFRLAREYVDRDSLWLSLGLMGVIACMAYSKYLGAIPLFFALLAVPRVLARRSFWIVIAGAAVLFLPHLFWQYAHDFSTFRFHLYDRMAAPWEWTLPLNYIGGQLLVFGPLIGFVLFPAAWKKVSLSTYDRIMHFSLWGMLCFFLLMSFRGRVEANWSAPAIVPLVYLAYRFMEPRKNWRKAGIWLAAVSWVLILAFRAWMAMDLRPSKEVRNEFHGWDVWADSLAQVADGRPVVFVNTYQLPSKYAFYAGGAGISLNNSTNPGNQYDLWPGREAALQGEEVIFFHSSIGGPDTFELEGFDRTLYRVMPDFHSYNTVQCRLEDAPEAVLPGDTIRMRAYWYTEGDIDVDIPEGEPLELEYLIMTPAHDIVSRGIVKEVFPIQSLKAGEEYPLDVAIPMPEDAGEYKCRLTLDNGFFRHLNMPFWMFEVEGE